MLALLIFIVSYSLPDRVFRFDCSTRQVYEEGAKEVALSVVGGINCKYTIYNSCSVNLPEFENYFISYFIKLYVQQVFLHMDKLAVERRTP